MGRGNVSKIMKSRSRAEERAAAKKKRQALMSRMNDALGAKGINELNNMSWGEKVNFVLSSAWILNAWYEKLGLLIVLFLAGWKFLNFFGWF